MNPIATPFAGSIEEGTAKAAARMAFLNAGSVTVNPEQPSRQDYGMIGVGNEIKRSA